MIQDTVIANTLSDNCPIGNEWHILIIELFKFFQISLFQYKIRVIHAHPAYADTKHRFRTGRFDSEHDIYTGRIAVFDIARLQSE